MTITSVTVTSTYISVASVTSQTNASAPKDINEFSVTTSVDDYLPQSRNTDAKKKHFKNLKEYTAYMMLLMQKLNKITPNGRQFVRMEDRNMLAKLEKELKSLTLDD